MKRSTVAVIVLAVTLCFLAAFLYGRSTTVSTSRHTSVSTTRILGVAGSFLNASSLSIPKKYAISWMRFDVNFEPQEMSYINNLSTYNYSVLGILDYETMCGTQPGSPTNCAWNLTDWNGTVAKAVEEFPNIRIWEIYNEPQLSSFYSGFYNGSPYNYYLMLKSSYKIIKAHDPNDTVLCLGGDNLYEGGGTPNEQDYEWAQQLWSYGASNYCDAISLHAYSNMLPMSAEPEGSAYTVSQIFNQSIAQYENLTGKPVWITEVGIPSNNGTVEAGILNNSLQNQATFLNQSFSLFLSKPYVKAVFWFHLVGTVNPTYHFDYGLFSQNMTPKPALYGYDRYAAKYGGV